MALALRLHLFVGVSCDGARRERFAARFALGLGTAFGSVGQIVFSPITNGMIESLGWYDALVWLSIISLFLFPLAFALPSGRSKNVASGAASDDQTLRSAIAEEQGSHRGYVLLTLGFVCGFRHIYRVHFPAYVVDVGLTASVGANALAIVGIFNIVGSIGAGVLAKRWTMKNCLAVIYFLRSIAIVGVVVGTPDRYDHLCLLHVSWSALARYRAADDQHRRPGVWCPLPCDAVWLCFSQPSGGELFGRVVGRHHL